MTFFGKPLADYVSFSKGVTVLVLLVGLARLGGSLGGLPVSQARWLSMNVVLLLGVIYLGFRAHTTGFGSYKHLLPIIMIPNAAMHLIAILGIVAGIISGHDNVFTAPEFAFGGDGKTVLHAGMHLVLGVGIGGLVNWLLTCLFFFIARKTVRGGSTSAAARV